MVLHSCAAASEVLPSLLSSMGGNANMEQLKGMMVRPSPLSVLIVYNCTAEHTCSAELESCLRTFVGKLETWLPCDLKSSEYEQ